MGVRPPPARLVHPPPERPGAKRSATQWTCASTIGMAYSFYVYCRLSCCLLYGTDGRWLPAAAVQHGQDPIQAPRLLARLRVVKHQIQYAGAGRCRAVLVSWQVSSSHLICTTPRARWPLLPMRCGLPIRACARGFAAQRWARNALAGAISGREVSACCASVTSCSKYLRAFWRSPAASAARAAP